MEIHFYSGMMFQYRGRDYDEQNQYFQVYRVVDYGIGVHDIHREYLIDTRSQKYNYLTESEAIALATKLEAEFNS